MTFSGANLKMTYVIQIILVMFLWSICFPVIVLGLPYAPHLTFAALRAFLAGAVLLIPSILMKRQQPQRAKIWLILAGIGFGATTLGFFGMFHASEFVSPGIATVVANTQPLMAMILASVFLKERLDGLGKIGFFLGFSGILVIASPSILSGDDANYLIGIFYIILAALGITVSNVLIRKIAGQIDALTAMGWQLMFGSFFLALLAFFSEDITSITWNTSFLFSLLILALPGTALAYWLWFKILEKTDLNHANSFNFLVPIFGLTMAVMFFDEKITMITIFGVILIIAGITIVNLPRQRIMIKNRGL